MNIIWGCNNYSRKNLQRILILTSGYTIFIYKNLNARWACGCANQKLGTHLCIPQLTERTKRKKLTTFPWMSIRVYTFNFPKHHFALFYSVKNILNFHSGFHFSIKSIIVLIANSRRHYNIRRSLKTID